MNPSYNRASKHTKQKLKKEINDFTGIVGVFNKHLFVIKFFQVQKKATLLIITKSCKETLHQMLNG